MAAADVREDPMATVQDVLERLASIKAPGTFATRRTAPVDDLRLEVKGTTCPSATSPGASVVLLRSSS